MQIQTGTVSGTNGDPGWNLAHGNGWRTYRQNCVFQLAFPSNLIPTVMLTVTQLDVAPTAGCRVRVDANNITSGGFEADISTWADTIVYSCRVQWLAILP